MSGKLTAETKEAMRQVDAGVKLATAARACGIARSTLIRALKRRRKLLEIANVEAAEHPVEQPEEL